MLAPDTTTQDPASAAVAHLDEPAVLAAYTSIAENLGPALLNLAGRLGVAS